MAVSLPLPLWGSRERSRLKSPLKWETGKERITPRIKYRRIYFFRLHRRCIVSFRRVSFYFVWFRTSSAVVTGWTSNWENDDVGSSARGCRSCRISEPVPAAAVADVRGRVAEGTGYNPRRSSSAVYTYICIDVSDDMFTSSNDRLIGSNGALNIRINSDRPKTAN